ncbi:MAG: sigma-54-dependent Fis family transcriptional regulator [Rhodospirillaceae bacterium TMED8]|nr:sigma-54-dependent Fis family transcriptional regulator [Magnetovibrio sp.]OUT50093.1 MAG: sigma-54-dependent Fis family transcriptional regulator [Rhodospirillaceae bacterium TMED8]
MRLLIIGTLNGQIGAASQIAMKRGASVQQVDSEYAALETLRAGKGADLIMADVSLDVEKLINGLANERIVVPVVACGVGNDTQAAVRAIRAGAREYLPLPPDAELIAAVLQAVAEESQAIIYKDPRMGEVMRVADQVAPSEASILVTGPSGTGKELMARHIHNRSKRRDGPFVAVNCAAIPENLLESELFGHEKGSFTGAIARRIGKFEEADGGTILLDEISEMDPRLQAKLLRAIQEREIDRVGGKKPVYVNVRIVATSNRNMEEEVAKGSFREDLFFRLNVMNLKLPALRERPADIPELAAHFITKYAEINDVKKRSLSKAAKLKLQNHQWAGNVRELENTMHRAILLAEGSEIDTDDIILTASVSGAMNGVEGGGDIELAQLVGRTVAEVERELIIDTLLHCLGNRTHAANILGISIRTLRNKLKIYGDQGFQVPLPGETSP